MRLDDGEMLAGGFFIGRDEDRVECLIQFPGGIVGDVDQLMRGGAGRVPDNDQDQRGDHRRQSRAIAPHPPVSMRRHVPITHHTPISKRRLNSMQRRLA